MPLPSQQQLDERERQLRDRLARLRGAYDHFLQEWQSVESHEEELQGKLSEYIDKHKVKKVLEKIHSIEP